MFDDTKLLVVDDEEVICQACKRLLTSRGFDVDTTSVSIDGLDWAIERDYAAVLLDIKMAGMDGIEFLERLQAVKPDVPVILITGYPNIRNAAAAVRLRAADYVTKPFTPESIIQAVRRALCQRKLSGQQRASQLSEMFEPWVPADQQYRFWSQSWMQQGEDGSVRVGAVPTRGQAKDLADVRMPSIGETVYQGLPLAGLADKAGNMTTVPAPVSGVVVGLNEALTDNPHQLADEPLGRGWIACICPTRFEEELEGCRPRNVLLFNADKESAGRQQERLEALGCQVQVLAGWEDLADTPLESEDVLFMIDAASFGAKGPELVERINMIAPGIRTVIIASPGSKWEAAFRAQRIFYYAVTPFEDNEIVDVLDAAFRVPAPKRSDLAYSGQQSDPVNTISISNGTGRRVRLLAGRGVLGRNGVLARQIAGKLRDRLFEVHLDGRPEQSLTPMSILDAAQDCDRLLVLVAKDANRLPGTLVRDSFGQFASPLCDDAGNVTTLILQPAGDETRVVEFDPSTTNVLAEHIAEEMTLCYRVGRKRADAPPPSSTWGTHG